MLRGVVAKFVFMFSEIVNSKQYGFLMGISVHPCACFSAMERELLATIAG